MAGTHVTLTADAAIRDELGRRKAAGTGSRRELMHRLGEYLLESTQNRYTTQTGPDGQKWEPLKPRYARTKKYNADKILTLRGYLRRSYRYQVKGDDALQWGTNDKRAAVHQFGDTIERAPYSKRVRLRTDGNGNLLLRAGKGKGKLATFARERGRRAHAQYRESWHEVGPYSITIPARPALGVSDQDHLHLVGIIQDYLGRR